MATLDEFGRHEVIHTASIIHDMFETHICEHDAVVHHEDVNEAAEKVAQALFDFYQLVGAKWLGGDHESGGHTDD